jgi:hypothetical protein
LDSFGDSFLAFVDVIQLVLQFEGFSVHFVEELVVLEVGFEIFEFVVRQVSARVLIGAFLLIILFFHATFQKNNNL